MSKSTKKGKIMPTIIPIDSEDKKGLVMAVGAVATGAPPERLSLSPHESSLQRGSRLPTGSVSRGQPRLSLVRARNTH